MNSLKSRMILEDTLKCRVSNIVEQLVEDLSEEVSFVNVSGNKWLLVINFDLDASSLSDSQKKVLSAILGHI